MKSVVLRNPGILFYSRYIDNCLSIILADTEEEALGPISRLTFDGCTIEWNVSALCEPFLDMLIYLDSDNSLQHMLFWKVCSHQERVPWISAHPVNMKRGVFIGKIARLATLCSTYKEYLQSVCEAFAYM